MADVDRRPAGREDSTPDTAGSPFRLPSIPNLRDAGGLATRTGARLRTGLLYRSSGLHGIGSADAAALELVGLRTVYDLRMMREQTEAPDRLPSGVRHVSADVLAGWGDGGPARMFAWAADPAAAREALAGGRAEALWMDQYRAFVRLASARAAYGGLLRDLACPTNRPALVHCATGKDRTGWIVAVLQLRLDVPEDAVMAHYLESREHLAPLLERMLAGLAERGGDPELFRPVLDVRPGYLEAGLEEVRAMYGSIEAYVSDGLGVDEETLQALREAFLS